MNNKKTKNELISLKNKIAVVAGGSNQTGRAIAERLAEAGARVVIADLNLINAEIVVQGIADKFHTEAMAFSLCATELDSVPSTIRMIEESIGGIDIWINAQTILFPSSLSTGIPGLSMENHTKNIYFICNEVARSMILSQTQGIIVNIVPIRDFANPASFSDYLASKFNLAILTKRFSVQLKTHGIQVFAIAPFPFKTTNSKNAESIIQYIMPDNVARLILHCLLDFSHAVSGKVITLNGNKIFVDITD